MEAFGLIGAKMRIRRSVFGGWAVVLCTLAVGATTWATVRNTISRQRGASEIPAHPRRWGKQELVQVAWRPQASGQHPFPERFPAPDFPKDLTWINTSGSLPLRSLRGKFVLLDFWTYCCINCIHILPELKKLERAYPNELVVIGVHSAKFQTERDTKNIEEAVLRYEIEHPVVNDAERQIWNAYSVNTWPSIRVIDPQGNYIGGASGEFKFETMDKFFKQAIPYYRKQGLLDESPIRFELAVQKTTPTPLRFPGKLLADPDGERLFISDSNHNRIVIAGLDGALKGIVGSGAIGRTDGDWQTATFDHPQGMALVGDRLYVADTENHLIRRVDLREKRVTTVAGTGEQSPWPFPGTQSNRRERLSRRVDGPAKRTAPE